MRSNEKLPPQFDAVLDSDEQVLWVGKPNITIFMLTGIPFLVIGLLWGSFDYFGIISHMKHAPYWHFYTNRGRTPK